MSPYLLAVQGPPPWYTQIFIQSGQKQDRLAQIWTLKMVSILTFRPIMARMLVMYFHHLTIEVFLPRPGQVGTFHLIYSQSLEGWDWTESGKSQFSPELTCWTPVNQPGSLLVILDEQAECAKSIPGLSLSTRSKIPPFHRLYCIYRYSLYSNGVTSFFFITKPT